MELQILLGESSLAHGNVLRAALHFVGLQGWPADYIKDPLIERLSVYLSVCLSFIFNINTAICLSVCLSVCLQSCNSRVIFKKLSKLSKCNFDDFLYDKDVQHFVH